MTRYEPAIDVASITAIDVHVHIEMDAHGHNSLPDDLAAAAAQVGRSGSPEQVQAAIDVLDDARRKLYSILAQD